MEYSLHIVPSAERQYKKFPSLLQSRLEHKISSLSVQPRPSGSEKLQGTFYYRIRIGDYRVIYSVDDAKKLVTVLDLGHRREIYRKW